MLTTVLALAAGFSAAFVALIGNRWAVRGGDRAAVAALVPLVEETAKTGAALIIGAPILATHVVFGLIEAGYDVSKRSPFGLLAGFVGLVGHLGFGLTAGWVYGRFGSGPAAVAAATLVHIFFNAAIIGRLPAIGRRRGDGRRNGGRRNRV
ncbi:MAG: hypothetical protein ACYC6V_08105 [Bacillota bacterium]